MTAPDRIAPAPWVSRNTVRAGGLIGVGFSDASDMLLIATHDGLGVVDCLTGQLLARNPDPFFPFDEITRIAKGIGPLLGEDVEIAGEVYGGSLSHATNDGWGLAGELTNQSSDVIRLIPPEGDEVDPVGFTDFVPEVRVFGFSPTGRSFVIGTGGEVYTFAR